MPMKSMRRAPISSDSSASVSRSLPFATCRACAISTIALSASTRKSRDTTRIFCALICPSAENGSTQ